MQLFQNVVHRLHSTGQLPYFLAPVALLYFADATLAYTFPILLNAKLNSPATVGTIMAFSSFVGIICDMLFPKLLARFTWHRLVLFAAIASIGFTVSVFLSSYLPILFGLIAVSIWGTYYELIGFSQDRFVVHTVARARYMRTWALIGIASLFAIIVGPLFGAYVMHVGLLTHALALIAIQVGAVAAALYVARLLRRRREVYQPFTEETSDTSSLFGAFKYWRHLIIPLAPVLCTVFIFRALEASYWMFGALFAQQIGGVFEGREWLYLLLYTLPFALVALTLTRVRTIIPKRRTAHSLLVGGGICIAAALLARQSPFLFISLLLIGNTCFAAMPFLMSTVSSGVQEYLPDRFRPYVTGLVATTSSLAYIIAPLIGGTIAERVGFETVFHTWAWSAVLVGLLLIMFSPKHIKISVAALTRTE